MHDNHSESQDLERNSPGNAKHVFTCLVQVVTVIGCLLVLLALLLPAVSRARYAARRPHCKNNLRQLSIALYNYHDDHGEFPPAYTSDAQGKPLHSWRTLILPYFDNQPAFQELYEKIDLSKPWDDPANAVAYNKRLEVFSCPSLRYDEAPLNYTTYLAAVTPKSGLRATEPRSLAEIASTGEETLLLIEVPEEHAVHWMAPQDADEKNLNSFGPESRFAHTGGSFAAFVDGSVRFIEWNTSAAERRALIFIVGDDK